MSRSGFLTMRSIGNLLAASAVRLSNVPSKDCAVRDLLALLLSSSLLLLWAFTTRFIFPKSFITLLVVGVMLLPATLLSAASFGGERVGECGAVDVGEEAKGNGMQAPVGQPLCPEDVDIVEMVALL